MTSVLNSRGNWTAIKVCAKGEIATMRRPYTASIDSSAML
jgi:hypothetical protein